jgi:TetR/AcrR family fatty acid metabolism transcriptional regulator
MENFAEKQQKILEEATRRHIFEAVVQVTQRGNTSDFTMQQVADEAGMAIGSLYNYFKNKDSLMVYIFRQLLTMSKERCTAIAQGPGPANDRLRRVIAQFVQFGREYVILFRIFDRTGLHQRIPEEQRNRDANEDVDQIRLLLAEGIMQGVFREMDTLVMARILFACMVGLAVTQPISNDLSAEKLSEELMRLFHM